MNRLPFCLLIPLIFLAKTSLAQESNTTVHPTPKILSSSGFEQNGSEGLSFSVGSLNSVIVLAAQDSVSQNAILQDTTLVAAALIDSIPQISEDLEEALSISLHPNPFVDRITLTIDGFMSESEENYHFELYDLAGNLLNTGQVGNRQEEILLNSIPKGIYILLLYKNEKEIESFKLIQSNQ